MSVQIMRDTQASPTQTRYEGYYAYFGTYDFDEAKAIVIHHVKGALHLEGGLGNRTLVFERLK